MGSEPVKFYIHYDIENHFIPMSDFLTASNAAQKIVDDLNKKILGGQLRYQLVVIPPEEGTFLKTVGIWTVKIAVAGVVLPIAGGLSLGAFKALSGNTPEYYGERYTEALRDMTVNFFSKEVEELEKCIPHELNLDRAFKAKTDFYISCQSNGDINGLGFDNTKRFPIRHDQFKNHISKDRVRPLDSDFSIYEAIVTSPVIEDKDYVWDFEDTVKGNKISGYMRDEAFKRGVLNGKYPFKTDGSNSDRIKMLVEYKKQERNGEVEKKETCIETVYSFNDIEITSIPANLPPNVTFVRPAETPMEKLWGQGR
ncbi:MAG: hypothetical protein EOM20_07920 [Spartobacteria bacterium]|nr:hypothetical protein [Spartobacteria bacterium]